MDGTLLLGALVVGIQVATGAVVWLAIRRSRTTSLIEVIGVGLGLGTLLSLIGSQGSILFGLSPVGWMLPILIALLVLLVLRLKNQGLGRIEFDISSRWLSVGIIFVVGFALLIPGFLRTPLSGGYVTGARYHGDLVFFEAVAQFVSRVGPGDSSLLADHGIKYHWFTYGWIGSLTDVINAYPFVVMTRIFPVVMVLGAAFLTVAWAARLSNRRWTPLLAGLLVVVAGFIGAEQGVILNFDSPSTAYAAVLALTFALIVTDFLRSESSRWPTLMILALLAAGMMGAKASQAAVVLSGLVAIAVASTRMPQIVRSRAWMALCVAGLAMVFTYVVTLAGVATSDTNIAINLAGEKVSTFQGLDPFAGPLGAILGSIALVLAILPRWLGTSWLIGDSDTRSSPETAFGVGVAVAGILPVLMLSSGTNAGWFAVAASPLLGVLSAVGLERAWRVMSGSLSRLLGLSVLAAGLVNLVVFVAYGLGVVSGAPVLWRGPVVAWISALLLAVAIVTLVKSCAKWHLRWLAAATTILVFASIGARFNGAAAWAVTNEQLTPAFEEAIRWADPSAQAAGDSESSTLNTTLPAAIDAIPAEPGAGVAGGTTGLLQWSTELNEAALWLEPQVQPGELVAVDATYLQPFLPVVTDLTMYVAGEPYISGYTTAAGVKAANVREERVRAFLEDPSRSSAEALWADNVRWLWLQKTPRIVIEKVQGWASVVRTNDQVTIIRLNDPDANSESRQ